VFQVDFKLRDEMGVRSRLLYEIEEELRSRDIDCRLSSIPDLRSALPGLEGPLGISRLSELLEELRSGCDLTPLLTPMSKRPEPEKKNLLSRQEIRLRYIKGESTKSIAVECGGISVKRVLFLIGNAAEIRRARRNGLPEKALIKKFLE
jgi:hypothetical protein